MKPNAVPIVMALAAFAAPCAAQTQADTNDAEQTAVHALLRAGTDVAVEVVESRLVGPDLWAIFADRNAPGSDAHELNACTVAGREGRRHASCIVLPTPRASTGFAAESSSVEELAHDRRAYVMLWVNYQGSFVRAGVGTDFHRLFVISTEAIPRLSLAIDVGRTDDAAGESMTTELSWRDVDLDRHPDLVVVETTCHEGGGGQQCQPPVTHTYLFTRATRRWTLRGR
ncbi:MAG: hypothetical protein ACHQX4_12180 [Gemmatimonadales bacterium]